MSTVRYVYIEGGAFCSRCQELTDDIGEPGTRLMVGDQFVCLRCQTEDEVREHGVRLLAEANERTQSLASEEGASDEFMEALEVADDLESILEGIDRASDAEALRKFIADVESGVKLAEAKGETYEHPDLIAKAQWARERLLLLSQGSS